MKRIVTAFVLTVGLLSGGQVLRAADEAGTEVKSSARAKETVKRMPFYGEVKKVDEKAKTLTLVGKEKDRVFRFTEVTRIHDRGEVKTLKDIQVGRRVGGLAKANASGQWEIATLNLGVKQGRASSTTETDEGTED